MLFKFLLIKCTDVFFSKLIGLSIVTCSREMHYPPETTNIMLLARIIATIEMAENKESVYNTFMQVFIFNLISTFGSSRENNLCGFFIVLSFVSQ